MLRLLEYVSYSMLFMSLKMPSKVLVNTHRLHQKQTDNFAQWLVDSADACGFICLQDTQSQVYASFGIVPSARLKGKVREKTRLKKPTTAAAVVEDTTQTYRIQMLEPRITDIAAASLDTSPHVLFDCNSIQYRYSAFLPIFIYYTFV